MIEAEQSALLEQRAVQIAVESRFITVSSHYLEEMGIDLDIVLNAGADDTLRLHGRRRKMARGGGTGGGAGEGSGGTDGGSGGDTVTRAPLGRKGAAG